MGAKKYIIEVNGNEYEVLIKDREDIEDPKPSSETLKSENSLDKDKPSNISEAQTETETPTPKRTEEMPENLKQEGLKEIEAPMAGNITSINCEPGDFVKKGDVIFILEAMKMGTEISSPMSGEIKQILISEGDSCERGTALALIQEEA